MPSAPGALLFAPVEPDENTVASPPPRRWRLAGACAAGAAACLMSLHALSLRADPAPATQLAALAASTAGFLLFAALTWAACGRRPVVVRLGLQPGVASRGVILLLVAGVLGLSHGLDRLIDWLGLRATSHLPRYDAAIAGAPEVAWPWLVLGLAIAPGIGEEVFFRGLIQRGLVHSVGRSAAIVIAAAAFGLMHGDPVHAAGAFGLGLYLGIVAELTGGTRAAITCHVLNNLAAVGGVALPIGRLGESRAFAVAGVAIAAGALWGASRLVRRETRSDGRPPPRLE